MRAKRRTKAEVTAVRETARAILSSSHPMTLRQLHYALVSRDDVIQPNTLSAYDTLGGWMRDDRLDGLIPWGWMEDRLRKATSYRGWADPAHWVEDVRDNYYRDPWQDQEHLLEVWIEKDALSGIFLSILGPYRVTQNVGRGYDGWSSIKQAASRYLSAEAKGKDVTVLYFGDFDPSGEDMHRSLEERLNRLDAYPEMPKVALKVEDARRLPGDVVKAGDSRADAFVAKYGQLAVELDALPRAELQERVETEVEAIMNMEALRESRRLEREQRRRITEVMDAAFADEDDGS